MSASETLMNVTLTAISRLGEDPEEPGGGEEEEGHPQEALFFCFMALTMGAITMHLLSRYMPSIPYTVVLLVEGLLLGILHTNTEKKEVLGSFNRSMEMWTHINAEVLLYVFLPALLFGECMTLRWHIVRKTMAQCLTLAGPGVLVGCFLTAAVAKWIFPYGWETTQCLTFGAILAATDPVAVVAILKELGASPKLTMIICGEALMNDGTAIVVTRLFQAMALVQAGNPEALHDIGLSEHKEEADAMFIFVFFIKMAICAAIFGTFTGIICSFFCSWAGQKTSHNDTTIQIAVCVCCAYLTFFIGDHIVGVSGVLATVVSGVIVSALAWPIFNDQDTMSHVWHMFEWIGNTLIFVLAGLIIGNNITEHMKFIGLADFGWLLVLYTLVNLIRFAMVAMFYPGLRCMGYGLDWKEAIILSYGGLRGAVGLALALETSEQKWHGMGGEAFPSLVVFHIGGLATLTVLVNGVTGAYLLRALGMTKTDMGKQKVFEDVKRRVKDRCEQILEKEVAKVDGFSEAQQREVRARVACLKDKDGPQNTLLTPSGVQELTERKGIAVREFFYSNIKSAYAELMAKGVLRQDGPQEMLLRSSIEFAMDNIESEGLRDWDYVADALKKHQGCCSEAWRKTLSCLTGALTFHEHGALVAVHDRTCVYLLQCFITAHREAQYVLEHFLDDQDNQDDDGTSEQRNEKEATLQASRKNVEQAQAKLADINAKDPDLVSDVMIQQVACVVLEEERRFVDQLASGGVLDDAQAHELYHDIEHDITAMRYKEGEMKRGNQERAAAQSFRPPSDEEAPGGYKRKSDRSFTDAAQRYAPGGNGSLPGQEMTAQR